MSVGRMAQGARPKVIEEALSLPCALSPKPAGCKEQFSQPASLLLMSYWWLGGRGLHFMRHSAKSISP
jgi:hypothetical protein